MKETKVTGFRLSDEDVKNLDAVCSKTKMNRSEVIRQLLKKCRYDEYCQEIIRKNFIIEKTFSKEKGELRIMSNLSNGKKEAPEPSQERHSEETTSKKIIDKYYLLGKEAYKIRQKNTRKALEKMLQDETNGPQAEHIKEMILETMIDYDEYMGYGK